jgi:hypothetical protein
MRPAARSSNAPERVAPDAPSAAFAPEATAGAVAPERRSVTGWASRALLFAGVVIAVARAAPNAGPLALAGRLARETLQRGVPGGAESLGWLGACAMDLVSSLGSVAVVCASVACAAGAFALVEFRSQAATSAAPPDFPAAPVATPEKRVSTSELAESAPLQFLAAPLAALCTLDALAPGAGTGAWLAWACVLILLDRPSRGKLAALGAATVLWCNLEPEGLLAPLAALAVAFGATLDAASRWSSAAVQSAAAGAMLDAGNRLTRGAALRHSWLAALIAVAATCCTPAGFGFAPAALVALRLGHAARGIVASSPAAVAPHAYPAGVAVVVAFALAAGLRTRGLREALPVVLAFLLALANGAFLPLFGIAAAPAIVAGLRRIARTRRLPAMLAPALAAAAACAIVSAASATAREDGPISLARREAAAHAPRGVLFCAKVAWCDVALAAGERVVVDGRVAPYGAAALDEQRTIVAVGSGWRGSLRRSAATAALAAKDTALATLLGLSPEWRLAARDGQAVLFERAAR